MLQLYLNVLRCGRLQSRAGGGMGGGGGGWGSCDIADTFDSSGFTPSDVMTWPR